MLRVQLGANFTDPQTIRKIIEPLPDAEILRRLLALNRERAGAGR